ncbi:MAG TPA: SRPBCC family protein, partial [Vicinamibacteria bacterium]
MTTPVGRLPYALTGFGLMGLKYAVEAAVIYAVTGRTFMPWQFLSPLMTTRTELLRGATWLLWVLVVWTLPFMWIGVVMTLRRALDAGIWPVFALLYFVPGVNYVVMLTLCVLPSRPLPVAATPARAVEGRFRFGAAVLGVLLGVSITSLLALLSVQLLKQYSATLFLATPLIVGACCGIVLNYRRPQPIGPTIGVALAAMVITGGAFLLFALEGIVCLAMAAPIALPMAVAGALLGRAMAGSMPGRPAQAPLMVVALPVLLLAETGNRAPSVASVTTTIEIDAPPERVWPHVVGFEEIRAPRSWIFRAGIACPMRARIDGRGVGAVRHCEFTTGPFVEPITVWDEPRRLAF